MDAKGDGMTLGVKIGSATTKIAELEPVIEQLKAEAAALKDALETQIYHFETAMNNEDSGPWYEAVQDAKKLLQEKNHRT